MALIEIVGVKQSGRESSEIRGAIGKPKPGTRVEASSLRVAGWVFGRKSPAVGVELVSDGQLFHRAPLGFPRPSVAAGYPDVPEAGTSGFRTTVSVLAQPELELAVRAILRDQRRVPLGLIEARVDAAEDEPPALSGALVSMIIPCHDHAHFLDDALQSVLAQTHPALEVIVVDDGSRDNTPEVVGRYPGVRYVHQENQGLAAARNAGIRESSGDYLVFLDADDRLLASAVESGLRCFELNSEYAFVFGRFNRVTSNGTPLPWSTVPSRAQDHYLALLGANPIAMHATVMYRRSALEAVGGFDSKFAASEDYHLFLRIASKFPIRSHREVVAEYRLHGSNMSNAPDLMLRSSLAALRSQRSHARKKREYRRAYREGRRGWRELYGGQLIARIRADLSQRHWRRAIQGVGALVRHYPRGIGTLLGSALVSFAGIGPLVRAPRPEVSPSSGRVSFGSLRRTSPISDAFGFDRGQPIDRYYIEDFLGRHADDIHGRVLEFGDDSYTRRFGGTRVTTSDVIAAEEDNPEANITADLANASEIPSDLYDCVICTQTLMLIYDIRSALETLYRILKPSGVLLATVPGITQRGAGKWAEEWSWGFTASSALRLCEEFFPTSNVNVETHGNVLAAIAFLHGLAAEELRRSELDHDDPAYQVTIAIRAVKPEH